MSIKVTAEWWKTLFDEVYLITDARSVCNEALTAREVDLISGMIPMQPNQNILDLCGGHGRHSLELCRRGFTHCTVFDFSRTLLRIGARQASQCNLKVEFVQGACVPALPAIDAKPEAVPCIVADRVETLASHRAGYAFGAGM